MTSRRGWVGSILLAAAVFMIYSEPDEDLPAGARPGQGIHHPRFARLLSERLGIPWGYRHTRDGKLQPAVGDVGVLQETLEDRQWIERRIFLHFHAGRS